MAHKKLITDQSFVGLPFAITALQETAAKLETTFAIDLAEIIHTNLPTIAETNDDGEEEHFSAIGQDEAGLWMIDDSADTGTLVMVVMYGAASVQPDATQPPLAVPEAVYIVSLPTVSELFTSPKLAQARDDLMQRNMLAAARRIAKDHHAGKAPLVVDRGAAFLTATQRGGAAKFEAAYNVMFRAMQQVILMQAKSLAKRLRDQNQHARARDVENVFSASRMNKATLKAAFASKEAAEYHFPSLPQAQWEALLRMAIQSAPKFAPRRPVRNEEGKILKDDEGNSITEIVPLPQSPAIFQQWLATRDTASFDVPEADDAPALTFEGLAL